MNRNFISTILETTKDGCFIWRKYLYLDFNGGLWYRRITAVGLLRFILSLHSGACPTTWYENDGWCYRIFPELPTNWYQGADLCRSENADLLVIDSQVKLLNISNISLTCFRSPSYRQYPCHSLLFIYYFSFNICFNCKAFECFMKWLFLSGSCLNIISKSRLWRESRTLKWFSRLNAKMKNENCCIGFALLFHSHDSAHLST